METLTTGKIMGMKRNYLYILLILAIVSCSKTEEKTSEIQAEYSPKFYADLGTAYTKTFVDDCLQIYWNKNDKISVFTSTANQLYKFDGDTGDSEGEFSVVEIDKSSTGERLAIDANFAVYPFQEETTISSDGTLTMSVPEIQYYSKKGFGLDSNPMVAVTENKNDTFLSFKNVCGYLRLFLYGENITAKRIRLEGNLKEPLSGKADVVMSYGQEPDISLHGDSHTITLDCSDGVKLGQSSDTATEFWFVLPPVNFTNGFTIIIEDDCGNKYTKSTANKIEIKRNTISNMVASKVEQLIEYEELTYEEDGIDAIVTNDGLFALLKQLPDSENYIFLCGDINDDKRSCMLIDKNGFLNNVDFGNGITNSILYTSNSLLLLESSGSIQYEIPYTALFDDDQINAKGTRAADYTQSRIYNALNLYNNIESCIDGPKKYFAKYLIRRYLEGRHGRKGSIAADIIDIVSNPKDLLAWDKLFNRIDEFLFFGNASVLALDAIMKDPVSFCLPCEVKGLNPNPDFTKAIDDGVYATKLLEHSYTLKMFAQCDEQTSSESYNKEEVIDDNGIVNFDFTFLELSALYSYEPRLTVNLKYEAWISEEVYYRAAAMVPNAPSWTPNSQIFQKSCTFYGIGNYLVTGSVTSYVEKVDNVKATSADITYNFSNVPSGAECEILVTPKGWDMSLIYPGKPGSNNEKIAISGLTPSTDYTATSRITYKGIAYTGTKSVSFCTPGPSGQILSIPNDDITTSSAILKCIFSNVEDGVTCGIIVKGEDGSNKSISASNIESEQTVTVSGLKPATTYTCTPYVRLTHSQGSYYKEGTSISFTTKLPDVTGTWNCREKHYKTNGEEYYQTYSVTLHEDGTVTTTLYDSYSATWGRSKTALSVHICLTGWNNDSGHDLSILFDDPTNPTSGKGRAKTWAVSAMTGTGSSHYFDLEMTK